MSNAAQQINDGVNAQALMDNPVFQAVIMEIETEITETWKSSDSPTERETQWQRLQALASLRQTLQLKINRGLTLQQLQLPM